MYLSLEELMDKKADFIVIFKKKSGDIINL